MTQLMLEEAYKIVREFFPDASDEHADSILWNKTGWPSFFEGTPEEGIRESLRTLKETIDAGHRPCCFCNERATLVTAIGSYCKRCWKASGGEQPYWWALVKQFFRKLMSLTRPKNRV